MGHGCEGSFYVAGLKVRSGTVTASWTKDGVTRTARVFTDGAQAKAHAARTGEDVITQNALAQLPGTIAITARLDGVDGELPFDPRASSRAARRSFDPAALQAALSPEAYARALDIAARNLPVDPTESRAYSEQVATAWLATQSPIGLAYAMADRPGTFVLDAGVVLAHSHGNTGVAAAVLEQHCRVTLTQPEPALSPLAAELAALAALDPATLSAPSFRAAHDAVLSAARDQLLARPHEALAAMLDAGAVYERHAGSALALVTVQAHLEAAMLSADEEAFQRAEGLLDSVCAEIARRRDAEASTTSLALAGDVSVELQLRELRGTVRAAATQRILATNQPPAPSPSGRSYLGNPMRHEYERLTALPRMVGALPTTSPSSHTLSAEHTEARRSVEQRWAEVTATLDARYGVVASASSAEPRRVWLDPVRGHSNAPARRDGVALLESGWWVAQCADGSILTYTHGDSRDTLDALHGDPPSWAHADASLNITRYPSTGAALMGIAEPSAGGELLHQLATEAIDALPADTRRDAAQQWDRYTMDPKRHVRPTIGALMARMVPTLEAML